MFSTSLLMQNRNDRYATANKTAFVFANFKFVAAAAGAAALSVASCALDERGVSALQNLPHAGPRPAAADVPAQQINLPMSR
jgi:hypothetical protein